MISRLVTIAALAGTALASLPAVGQTGMTPQAGTPDTAPGAGTDAAPSPAPVANQAQAAAHARHVRHMTGNDAAERRVTECLNSAAAQQSPLDTCRR